MTFSLRVRTNMPHKKPRRALPTPAAVRRKWTGPYRMELGPHPYLKDMFEARIVEVPTDAVRLYVDGFSVAEVCRHVLSRYPMCEGLPEEFSPAGLLS